MFLLEPGSKKEKIYFCINFGSAAVSAVYLLIESRFFIAEN